MARTSKIRPALEAAMIAVGWSFVGIGSGLLMWGALANEVVK